MSTRSFVVGTGDGSSRLRVDVTPVVGDPTWFINDLLDLETAGDIAEEIPPPTTDPEVGAAQRFLTSSDLEYLNFLLGFAAQALADKLRAGTNPYDEEERLTDTIKLQVQTDIDWIKYFGERLGLEDLAD